MSENMNCRWSATTLKLTAAPAACSLLKCPRCYESLLHHGRVTVFDREEDDGQTMVTTVEAKGSATRGRPPDEVANPSFRRDGIAIAFKCEMFNLGSRPLGTWAPAGADNPLNDLAFGLSRSGNSPNH
jgi:hypothetical protein